MTHQKLALIVDDSMAQRMMLSAFLKEEGYQVIVAKDGACGVQRYIDNEPDLVLMDINMPVMDGYEAARQIKKLSCSHTLAPLIFITSMSSEEVYIESVEAGGDGILVAPFSAAVFKAKIKSIQRISNLYERIKNLQQEQDTDAKLAEKMMSEAIESKNFALDRIGIIKQAATIFSGDIQLSALCPNGDVHILLGDFTGHGLRSTIGAIPVAETFRAMTKKGFSLFEIIAQVNRQLNILLPKDLFFAACFASISEHEKTAYVFNAGLPDSYIYNQQANIKHSFSSKHPPLGILPELLPAALLDVVAIEENERLILITDGIIEARNDEGEEFGVTRFEQAVEIGMISNNVVKSVQESLRDFCQNMPQEDDISLIDVPCSGWENTSHTILQNNAETYVEIDHFLDVEPAWNWHLHLTGELLAKVNPIPLIMNQINDIEGAGKHWQSLYTILTELYVNALDHGVLALSSSLKTSPEGFSQYYNERAKRLNSLHSGFVRISLKYYAFSQGGRMVINIKDSGKGFDIHNVMKKNSILSEHNTSLNGRGVDLVSQLCDTLEYLNDGTSVSASYIWHHAQKLS
ncbi:MAG: SpoIIE family protein phosphatase [Colwellia sp.]